MKKLVAIILSAAIVLSLSVSAFATDLADSEIDGSKKSDVVVVVKDKNGDEINPDNVTKVYKVAIEWKEMKFSFKADQETEELTWDPDTHTYSNLTGKWMVGDAETDTIAEALTISNHSNNAVTYAVAFENAADASAPKTSALTSGVTSTLAGTDGVLASAEGTTYDEAPKATYDVSVAGTPTLLSTFTVDTVVVSLTK